MRDNVTIRARSAGLDALRVVGIVAVVAGHVWGDTALRNLIYPWHVPVFFVLTGYLWTPGRSPRTEISKRWSTLGRPYVFWLIVIMIGFIVPLILNGSFTLAMLKGPLYGGGLATRPFTTFWFVSVLFFAAVFYRILERVPRVAQWAIAVALLILAYVSGPLLSSSFLGVGLALPSLVFVLAGRELRLHRARFHRWIPIGIVLVVVPFLLVFTGISPSVDLKAGNFGSPVLGVGVAISISIGLVLLAEGVLTVLPGIFSRVSTRLATGAILVVLVHPGVLAILNTPEHGRKVGFLLALVVPWVLAMVLVMTPLSGWLTGTPALTRPDKPMR